MCCHSSPWNCWVLCSALFIKIKKEDLKKSWKWTLSKPVLRYKEKMLPVKGVKYRVKYHLSKAISVFVNV